MQDPLSTAIHVVEAVALLILGIGALSLAVILWRFHRTLGHVDRAIDRIADNAGPALDHARAIGENINYIARSVRRNVEEASDTISHANARIEGALDRAEARVRELGALIDVLQGEVEDTLVSATSALRGLRTGARLLGGRRERRRDSGDSGNESEDRS